MTVITEWNYSALAAHYDSRAEYAPEALDFLFHVMGLTAGDRVADIGAGTGKLARPLGERGLVVKAVEPNDEMRQRGVRNTENLDASWSEGTGERTGLPGGFVRAVSFGSSFNVLDQQSTLKECRRIVEPRGWFCCLWNHRDLGDPIQSRIERIIRAAVPGYRYGTRREDPTEVLVGSGLFESVEPFSASFTTEMTRDAVMDAWRSHATLARQAGSSFDEVVDAISRELTSETVRVPYTTKVWYARFRR